MDPIFRTMMLAGGTLSIAIASFTIFVVLKSSQLNKSYYPYYLVYHVLWTLFFDICQSLFIIPEYIFPMPGGCSFGLFQCIQIHFVIQLYIGFVGVGGVFCSVIMLFHFRLTCIVPIGKSFVKNKQRQIVYFILLHLLYLNIMVPFLFSKTPEDELLASRSGYSKLYGLPFLNSTNCYFVLPGVLQLGIGWLIIVASSFGFICLLYIRFTLFYINSAELSLSLATRRLQKTLLKVLITQVSLPFIAMIIPLFFVIFISIYFDYHPILLHCSSFFTAHHGLIGCIVILSVNKQFRQFIANCCRNKRIKELTPKTGMIMFAVSGTSIGGIH